MSYAKHWQSLEHEDTNILLVKPKSFELINTTTESDEYHFLSSVMDSFNTDTTTLEQEGSTSANIVRNDFYKTILLSWQKRKIVERLAVIAQREDDWDGYDSKKPTEPTINRAKHFIEELLDNDFISARLLQLEPFICSDEDGYITFECYNDKRSLCFDIQENETRYTKIWRTSDNTMTQTDSLNRENHLTLWEWFLDE